MAYEQQFSMAQHSQPTTDVNAINAANPNVGIVESVEPFKPIDLQKAQMVGAQERANTATAQNELVSQQDQADDHATLSAAIKAGEYDPADPEKFLKTDTYHKLSATGQAGVLKTAMAKKEADLTFTEHVNKLSLEDQVKLDNDLANTQALYTPIVDAMDADGKVDQAKLEAARQYAKKMAAMETVRDPQTGQQKPKYTPEQLAHFDKLEVKEAQQAIDMTKYAQNKLELKRKADESAAKIRDEEAQTAERMAHANEYEATAWAKYHPNETIKHTWEAKTVKLDGQPNILNYDSKTGTWSYDGHEVSADRIQPMEGRGSSLVTGRYNPRTISAAKDVLNAMKTIDKIPVTVEGTLFGANKTAHTIFDDMSNYAQKKLSSESALNMNSVLTDLSRALGIALEMGGKSSESEVKQLGQYKIEAGIPISTAQMRLAGATQIVRNSLEAMETTGLPAAQKEEVDKLIAQLKKYPTQQELTEKYYSKDKSKKYGEVKPVVKGEAPTSTEQSAPVSTDEPPPKEQRIPGETKWRGHTWTVLPDGRSGWSKE